MRIKHKYLRNQAYKKKLEHKFCNRSRFCGLLYITREPDFDFDASSIFGYRDPDFYWHEDKQRYEYYSRPAVPYTVIKQHYWKKKNSYKSWLKRQCSKKFRKLNISCNGNEYQKYTEFWWNLD